MNDSDIQIEILARLRVISKVLRESVNDPSAFDEEVRNNLQWLRQERRDRAAEDADRQSWRGPG